LSQNFVSISKGSSRITRKRNTRKGWKTAPKS